MTMRIFGLLMVLSLILGGCGSAPEQDIFTREPEDEMMIQIINPYTPQEGDDDLVLGGVSVDTFKWDQTTWTLTISGNLPTPCNDLRINTVLTDTEIALEVYSLSVPETICAQMLEPFEAKLVIENFSKDEHSITINGTPIDL